jgi:hypothetical protein
MTISGNKLTKSATEKKYFAKEIRRMKNNEYFCSRQKG